MVIRHHEKLFTIPSGLAVLQKIINRTGFRFSIRLTVVGVFILATVVTASIAIGLQFHFSRAMAIDSAASRYRHTAAITNEYLDDIDIKACQIIETLSKHPSLIRENTVDAGTFPLFAGMMAHNPIFYGVYIGFGNGDFFEVINLDSSHTARGHLKADSRDRWVVMAVRGSGDERTRYITYYDDAFHPTGSRTEKTTFDPRIRPWFIHAEENHVYKTDPYLFHYLQEPGQSYSIRLGAHDAVLTMDITLAALSGFLRRQAMDPETEIYLYQKNGELIASNQLSATDDWIPVSEKLPLTDEMRAYVDTIGKIRVSNELDWSPIDFAVSGRPQGYTVDLMRMIGAMTGLEIEFVNGFDWSELRRFFENKKIDVLQPVFTSTANAEMGILTAPVLSLSYAAVTRAGEPAIRDIRQLAGRTIAIPAGWSIIHIIRTQFSDIRIQEVASPREAILAVVNNKAYATLDASIILHSTAAYYFIKGIMFHEDVNFGNHQLPEDLHFLIQKDAPQLAEVFNTALSHMDKSAIRQLHRKWFDRLKQNPAREKNTTVPYEILVDMTDHPRSRGALTGTLTRATINGHLMFLYIAELQRDSAGGDFFAVVTPESHLLSPSMQRVKISIVITALCLLLLLPLTWLFAAPIVQPIKRLALENEKIKHRQYEDVRLHDTAIREIYELSESIVDMAVTIKQHEESLKALLESFIQLIAQTIDDKSPYTAEHCARVPELALMLADAASRSAEKPFDQFNLDGEDPRREFRMAAWLHDCGKITTPEHIVNKATKLETIYNRIHEIRTRFEVLWRDAEIDYLKNVAHHPEDDARLREVLKHRRNQLQADFEFVADLNIGGESMRKSKLARLATLAETTWERHFDDRLGISSMESARYPAMKPSLPVTEKLIADKPEHIVAPVHQRDYAKKFGIRMEIPQHLFNLGERYNLSVKRGTLTREDRFKIQEHIISTIKMLESLPFPEELANVPRYASTHHETLRGTGYPRKLTRENLSIPERIIAVADIFEALTAGDRPYKKAKTLNHAVQILYDRVEAGDIDRDVFELFLTSRVYLTYSRRFLRPEQIDDVPVASYVRGV